MQPTSLLPITGGYSLAAVSAAISTLVDTFTGANGTQPSAALWHFDNFASGFATAGQGALNGAGQLVLKNGDASAFNDDAYYISNALYDLTGDRIVFRAPQMATITGTGAYEAGIVLRQQTSALPYGNNALLMTLQQDPGLSQTGQPVNFYLSVVANGSFAQAVTSHTYNAVNDYWWSLRENGAGTISWETAPNNGGVPGAWTSWATFAVASFPGGVRNLQVQIYYRMTSSVPAGTATAAFDQIGLPATGLNGAVANASEATSASTLAGTQVHPGAVAGASSVTTAGTVAGTQVHAGAVAGASEATSASTLAGTQSAAALQGVVANASSAGAASTPAGTQGQAGTVAGATSGTTGQAAAGTQGQAGAIASEVSATAASALAGTQRQVGAVAAASETTTASTASGTQGQAGTVAGAVSPSTASTPGGTQGQAGAIAGASSADAAGTAAGTQRQVGAVASASSATTVDPVLGSTGAVPQQGVVAGAASATSTSGLAGTQGQVGAIASAASATTVDAIAPAGPAPSGGGSRYLARLLRSQLGPQHAAPNTGDQQDDEALSIAIGLITSGALDLH